MASSLEDLRILQAAEKMGDGVWKLVSAWNEFARDTLGKQLTRAMDSIGANIAESFGRYAFGEKLQFLYYARGSLFETKYWLNRAIKRNLITAEQGIDYAAQLSTIGRQLNAFANSFKLQRQGKPSGSRLVMRESPSAYGSDEVMMETDELLSVDEIEWLASRSDAGINLESPIL